jgi:hypothetical protein
MNTASGFSLPSDAILLHKAACSGIILERPKMREVIPFRTGTSDAVDPQSVSLFGTGGFQRITCWNEKEYAFPPKVTARNSLDWCIR